MQIEQGNYEINYDDCSRSELANMIHEVVEPFQLVLKERELGFQLTEQSSVPAAFMIENKLYKEILYNLIQNAVKFNKNKGSIMASVRYESD